MVRTTLRDGRNTRNVRRGDSRGRLDRAGTDLIGGCDRERVAGALHEVGHHDSREISRHIHWRSRRGGRHPVGGDRTTAVVRGRPGHLHLIDTGRGRGARSRGRDARRSGREGRGDHRCGRHRGSRRSRRVRRADGEGVARSVRESRNRGSGGRSRHERLGRAGDRLDDIRANRNATVVGRNGPAHRCIAIAPNSAHRGGRLGHRVGRHGIGGRGLEFAPTSFSATTVKV